MYYTYFSKSGRNNDLYIGSCENLTVRIGRHNAGLVRSTKPNRPWKLVGYETHSTRSEAVRRERFLKTGQQKAILKRRFLNA